ncbi:MAG TPA: FecR domain-containing protein [Flavisolibacter sp.]|nr:FecR domain-containing protein [Flavisolibacter sp.]
MIQIEEKYLNLISKSLSKNLSKEEEQDLNQWLASDPSHLQLLQEFKASWDAADQYDLKFSPNKEQAWKNISEGLGFEETKEQAPIKTLFPWARIAAAVILALLGSWFFWRAYQQNNWIQVASENTIKEVLLPDNSKVWLSQNSSIRYQADMNQSKEREVELEGEAFFEVTHNPSKPFIVQALETETKVLGTSFNVLARINTNDIQVSVVTGKVQFKNNKAEQNKLILEPGTQGIYTRATAALRKRETKNQNFLFWKNKALEFDNETVQNVLHDLEKNYGVHFIIQKSSIGSQRITTSYHQESIEQIIKELSILLDVNIKKSDTAYLVQAIK